MKKGFMRKEGIKGMKLYRQRERERERNKYVKLILYLSFRASQVYNI